MSKNKGKNKKTKKQDSFVKSHDSPEYEAIKRALRKLRKLYL